VAKDTKDETENDAPEGHGKQDTPIEGQSGGNQPTTGAWGMNGQANGMFPFGYGGNQAGMGWPQPGVFNPMMQMQMQNNMGNGNWGYQNMMGSSAPRTSRSV
jgi:hypothetical protein